MSDLFTQDLKHQTANFGSFALVIIVITQHQAFVSVIPTLF